MLTAKEVAAYFIKRANTMGDGNGEFSGNNDLTNLKLQKLLYFAQVEYLKKYGKPLFSDPIEAWKYGPVVRAVYDWLRDCGAYVITEFDVDLSDADNISGEEADFLSEFFEKGQEHSAWSLVTKTHAKGSAWDQVYNNGRGNGQQIPLELLKTTYDSPLAWQTRLA